MKIRFLSSNKFKINEVKSILGKIDVDVVPVSYKIEELQTENVEALVRDKCIKAYRVIGRPLFVEHTGLYLDALNGFPAGLTQVFWDTLKADRISELFGGAAKSAVVAKTRIGYCDGKIIQQFEGQVRGTISTAPRGDRSFQWDCIFVPDDHEQTFAEMGMDQKNKISMRKEAIDKFAEYLRSNK